MPDSYHHGNLREALVEAGLALAREGGPTAVQLRAASREAGVSHNAAYRHFANQEDLLSAVADRCMTELSKLMIERTEQVKVRGAVPRAKARLRAIGRAYIDFARTEPGWFRTAFSSATPPPGNETHETEDEILGPFEILSARLDELVEVGALAADHREGAEFGPWSGVHGLSSLLLDGPLRVLPDAEVDYAIDKLLNVIDRGLY